MQDFVIMVKSYAPDFHYARNLISSFRAFCTDDTQLILVVPSEDVSLFAELSGGAVSVMSEEPLAQYFTDETTAGLRPGYINQEIVKLAFWELGAAENYLCLDSEAEFIRPFGTRDFMYSNTVPYSVLTQDLELEVDPVYFQQYAVDRRQSLEHIALEVGVDPRVILTCHGQTVFSATVLRSWKSEFLEPRGWTYMDALRCEPYEFTWYNMWLQKSGVIPVHPREPWIKIFHHEGQHIEFLAKGLTHADLARGYLGVLVNSNFDREFEQFDPQGRSDPQDRSGPQDKTEVLGRYLSYSEFFRLGVSKVKASFGRLKR